MVCFLLLYSCHFRTAEQLTAQAWDAPDVQSPKHAPANMIDLDYSGIATPTYATPRAEHSATLVDGRYMYIMGGFTTCNPSLNVVDSRSVIQFSI